MSLYRNSLPQLSPRLFLSDGGIETTLIFNEGIELPDFAAFLLFRDDAGRAALRKYFGAYTALAQEHGVDLILETATWRANPDWAARLGYSAKQLADVHRQSVRMLDEMRPQNGGKLVVSGCLGPRGDGYVPSAIMGEEQAADYHRPQIDAFAESAADLVTAITMNYVEEATGIAKAAKAAGVPVVISFTVETDGTLPSGESLSDAIDEVDSATAGYPAYFMINCAHPDHFDETLRGGSERWLSRIQGVRANASRMSHAELNEATELDAGNPDELAQQYAGLKQRLPKLNVMGGCCGTDHRHVGSIAAACAPLFPR